MHKAETLIPERSSFLDRNRYWKANRYKSPGANKISAELMETWGNTLSFEIHKFINSTSNKEELPQQWNESIIVHIYIKDDKSDSSNYRGTSLLPTTYNILSNILVSTLTPDVDEITGDYQCGFRRNKSTMDQVFCIRHILEKNH